MSKTYYWIKLYYDLLDDWKVGTLPDSLKWRFIQCLLVAGESREGGFLPRLEEFAYRIRVERQALNDDMSRLAKNELVELRQDGQGRERWYVTKFEERQSSISNAERQRAWRARQAESDEGVTTEKRENNEGVTTRYVDIDTDIDKDKDTEQTNMPAIAAEYAEFLMLWKKHLPEKPQPRQNNRTLQGKLKTRLKCAAFRESWRDAVARAGRSSFLNSSAWFDAYWFLKNDANWEKCNNGNYDDRANGNGRHQHHGQAYGYDNDILEGVQVFNASDAITR